jgi:hypothetical protein
MPSVAFFSAATLTASFVELGNTPVLGSWRTAPNDGKVAVWLLHTKDADQTGGYPVVRFRWGVYLPNGDLVTALDPVQSSAIAFTTYVADIEVGSKQYPLTNLTDSAGASTDWYVLEIDVPAWADKIILDGKQAGDTTAGHFGTLRGVIAGEV